MPPRTLTRSTQKPVSALWKVTRSTSPARASVGGAILLLIACRVTRASALFGELRVPSSPGQALDRFVPFPAETSRPDVNRLLVDAEFFSKRAHRTAGNE